MAGLALRIIVGLGNPGPEHQVTRHNAGFWFVDLLARRHGGEFRDYRKYSGETAKIGIEGHEVVLLKPTTYMNRSGLSIRQLSEFYKRQARPRAADGPGRAGGGGRRPADRGPS